MNYPRLSTKTNLRRSYTITFALVEGYEPGSIEHSRDEAYALAASWMGARCQSQLDYLTGIFTPVKLVYAWQNGNSAEMRIEEALVFSGEVSIIYAPDMPDEQVEELLDELASFVGEAMGQTRIYITYRNEAWILEAEGKTSPRGRSTE